MNIKNILRVKFLTTETLGFVANSLVRNVNKILRISDLEFGLSHEIEVENTITYFVVGVTYKMCDTKNQNILLYKTRSTYVIYEFHQYPNQALLEDYVFDAFKKHQDIFCNLVKEKSKFKDERIKNLKLENFQSALGRTLSVYSQSI